MAKLDHIEINGTPYELVPEIAPLFNTSTQYSTGDYVIKDAILYKFTTNHAAGAWNASHVTATSVVDEINGVVDNTLTTTGKAADAKATGDALASKINSDIVAPEFSDSTAYSAGSYVLKNGVLYKFTQAHSGAWTGTDAEEVTVGGELNRLDNGSGSGLTEGVKVALLACFEKVAWVDEDGQDYYDALYSALYPPADLVSISAVYTQSGTVYDTDSLDSLKSDLVVTAHMSDSTTQTITSYTLSGTLTAGTSTITVSYSGKTTTFNVTVTEWQPITQTITWSGNGADKTSTVIDATQYDEYFELPFVDGATELVAEATSSVNAFKIYDTYLYSDLECTTQVGRYHVATGEIGQTGKSATSHAFDTKLKVVPQGYYAKLLLNKLPTAFNTNADFQSYLNNYAGTVTLE